MKQLHRDTPGQTTDCGIQQAMTNTVMMKLGHNGRYLVYWLILQYTADNILHYHTNTTLHTHTNSFTKPNILHD